MPLPACFRLADDVFPRVRAVVARELCREGWSQSRAAKALGVSQTMVSRYMADVTVETDPLVLRLAGELRSEIDHPRPARQSSGWCGVLSRTEGDAEVTEAVDDLLAAERALLDANPLAVMPQIGLNIARALPGANGPDEVVSFPGRIVEAAGRLVNPVAPAFGGSGHLARCLLTLRGRDPALLALGSLRGGPDVARAVERLRWPLVVLERRGEARPEVEPPFHRAVERASPPLAAVMDPGAFGIEPCLYLAGPDARSVAGRILDLDRELVKTQ